jgi:hypothetical protein
MKLALSFTFALVFVALVIFVPTELGESPTKDQLAAGPCDPSISLCM